MGRRIKTMIFTCLIIISVWAIVSQYKQFGNVTGKVVLYTDEEKLHGISVYDLNKNIYICNGLEGHQAVFINDDELLLNQYSSVVKHDLNTGEEQVICKQGSFDFIEVVSEKLISLSQNSCIYLYNIESKEKKLLISDSGSYFHSWLNENTLYYSDMNGKIKSLNIFTGEIICVSDGNAPIACNDVIAYKKDNVLKVRDLITDKEYEYRGAAYSYCFSKDGKYLLLEDEMDIRTATRNFFTGNIVLGHKVVVWDFKNNKIKTIIDSCTGGGEMICDWW